MKRLVLLTTTLVLLSVASARSGEERKPASGDKPAAKPAQAQVLNAWGGGKSAADWYIESTDKVVGLTDAQKKAIKESFAARDKAMNDFQTKNAEKLKAASAAMMEAYKSKDKEAIAKVQKAYQELYAPMQEAVKKSTDELQKILTPEQKAKQQEQQFTAMVKAMTAGVQLSDEQMKKLRTAWDEEEKGDHEAPQRSWPKAFQEILTPDQRTAIARQQAMTYLKAAFSQANLTKDQLKQVEDLAEKYAKDRAGKPWEWQAYQKLTEQVNSLLTPEQKETMKKARVLLSQPGGALRSSAPGAPAGGAANPAPRKPGAAHGNLPATEKKPAGAKVRQVGPGQFEIEITELKPAEKLEKRRIIVLSEGKSDARAYWLGLNVQAHAQGLAVEQVAPDSPAAKGGLKPRDVLVKAGDKPLKSVAELIEAVQKAKETDLALEVLRDGKTQKFTIKPAKRPAEGLVYNLGELLQRAEPGKPAQPGTKVTQLPGGGVQVIIGQGAPGKEGVSREELQKVAKPRMRDTVKRQHELAEEAWQIYRKMEALGEGKTGKAHELWETLERIEGELRRTFEPAILPGAGGRLMPGTPMSPFAGRAVTTYVVPGQRIAGAPVVAAQGGLGSREVLDRRLKELNEKAEQLTKAGKNEEANRVKHEAHELHEALERLPRQQAGWQVLPMPANVRPGPELQELRNQVQELRRQMEELRAMVKKSSQPDKK